MCKKRKGNFQDSCKIKQGSFFTPDFLCAEFSHCFPFCDFCTSTGKGKCWKCAFQNICRGKGTDDFATIQGFCAKSVKVIFKTPAKSRRGLFYARFSLCRIFASHAIFTTFAPQRAMSNAGNVRSKIFAVAVKNGFCVVEMSLITSFLVEAKTCCSCLAGIRATVRPVFLRTKGVNRAFFRGKKPQNGKISLLTSLPMTDKALCLSYYILWEK